MEQKELKILEEITLDYNSIPFDDTEGAEERDLQLLDLLYEDVWLDEDEVDKSVEHLISLI